jgi:hypothetical protein
MKKELGFSVLSPQFDSSFPLELRCGYIVTLTIMKKKQLLVATIYIATCMCDYRWGLGFFNGFTDHLYTRLGTRAPPLISTLYKSLQHTLSLSLL